MFSSLFAQSKYSRLKIDLRKTDIKELNQLGLETDHGFLVPGVHFVNDFSAKEVNLIKEAGMEYFVLIEDCKAHYKNNQGQSQSRSMNCSESFGTDYQTPENYTAGSMGGYPTYSEMLVILDDMRAKYPNLISAKAPIGDIKTWDGNEILWLRVSDNADEDEDEPEALFTALHHAREPNGLSQMLFYIWYLLENYESDPEVKYLVDNTEQYFIPCVNPDGYIYNELTDPDGGGFWRKNRRPDDDNKKVGVDLNRNYGFFWGFDDFGSSPDQESTVYRGPEGFSEPETQAVRDFTIAHDFRVALNYHAFGNLLIHPWGYNDQPTEEDSIFKAMGNAMIVENDYHLGTGVETVGYLVNGDSDDYMYGEQVEKNKIYSLTPEVGSTFWPQESQIDELNKSSLRQNLATAHVLLNYYDVRLRNLSSIIEVNEGEMEITAIKAGLTPGDATITLESKNLDMLSFDQFAFTLSLEQAESQTIPVAFTIANNTPSFQELAFDIRVNNGEIETVQSFSFTFRKTTKEEIVKDEFTTLDAWIADEGSWALTQSDFVSAPNSLTDSPDGDYLPSQFNVIAIADAIDLGNTDFSTLKFNAKWEIEANYDYVLIQVSDDNGENWTSLCGNYTRPGINTHGISDPLYDRTQKEWVREEMDLSDYTGQSIQLRLVAVSDQFVELDGFFIDDIIIESQVLVVTGMDEVLLDEAMEIFPSLTEGRIEVNIYLADQLKGAQLEIFDMQGKLVNVYNHLSPKMNLDFSSESSGVYILKLTSESGKTLSRRVNLIR